MEAKKTARRTVCTIPTASETVGVKICTFQCASDTAGATFPLQTETEAQELPYIAFVPSRNGKRGIKRQVHWRSFRPWRDRRVKQ